MNNELVTIIDQSELPVTQAELLKNNFIGFFDEAKSYEQQAREIQVIDENDNTGMKKARELRIKLKNIRTSAENKRKELKEQSLREGKAIDGIANVIKALIVPIEDYLEKQEKFAEIAAENRKLQLIQSRNEQLSPYVADTSVYSLGEMSEDGFAELLNSSKIAKQAQIDAEKKAEEDRLANIEAERIENERIREENAKLRAAAEEQNRIAEQEKQKALEEERKRQDEIRKAEAEQRKIDEEAKRQAEIDRMEAAIDSVVDSIIACNGDREKIKTIIRGYIK